MKNLLTILLLMFTLTSKSQVLHAGEADWAIDTTTESFDFQMKATTAACGSPFVSSGYPLWTNYWAGWMVNIINTNACPITINRFEARFQGTAGYRIYTKVGTFVGFETTAGSWALVGNLAALTGTSTTAPTDIPIAVSVTIPVGGTQAFYLTRSDNVIANRHLYTTGAGIAGTTIYASNADLSITEGSYVDPYFAALQIGVRRPSFDVCYVINCPLPIELISFEGYRKDEYNLLTWVSASEHNNDYYTIERSTDGFNWIGLSNIDGLNNSNTPVFYEYKDYTRPNTISYYRLKQTDLNGQFKHYNIISVNDSNKSSKQLVKITNIMGQETTSDTGVLIYYYSDGTHQKVCKIQ